MKVHSTHEVGEDPDVLTFDPGLARLYVPAEFGTVAVFQGGNRNPFTSTADVAKADGAGTGLFVPE